MGLFDKFREVVDSVKSSVLSEDRSPSNRYYDIVLNLLISAKRLNKDHIKTFFKVKYNETCDDATLEKVLEKFDKAVEPKTQATWYELTSKQYTQALNKGSGASCFTENEVLDICFADYREEVRSNFTDMFEVVKRNPTTTVFANGIYKMRSNLPKWPDYPNATIFAKVVSEEIIKLLFADNDIIKEVVLDKALSYLIEIKNKTRYEYILHLYAFAIRAIHYEKADKSAEVYTSITETECKNAVYNSKIYQKRMEEDPFEKDKIVEQSANSFLRESIILGGYEIEWDHWAVKNDKFIDAACYFAWEKITTELGETTDNVEDAVNLIHGYLEDNT